MKRGRFSEIVNVLRSDKLLAKHTLKHTWTSGCVTEVYPIEIWERTANVQLDTSKNIFKKCIERIVSANPHLFKYGYFAKYDGSCPSELVFVLNDVKE
jgi:hypothetical protein